MTGLQAMSAAAASMFMKNAVQIPAFTRRFLAVKILAEPTRAASVCVLATKEVPGENTVVAQARLSRAWIQIGRAHV